MLGNLDGIYLTNVYMTTIQIPAAVYTDYM